MPTEGQKKRVVLCMVGDSMTTLDGSADDVWMLSGLAPNHEKRRSCPMSLQDVKQTRRILWMRAIIKGERGNRVMRLDMGDRSHQLRTGDGNELLQRAVAIVPNRSEPTDAGCLHTHTSVPSLGFRVQGIGFRD